MAVEGSMEGEEREALQEEKEGFVNVWFSFFDFVFSKLGVGMVWAGP
jgi:hypothetical protein